MSGYLVYLPSYFDRRMARTKKENTTPLGYIQIKGARTNNLKNIDLDIPKNKLIVFTGVSGSGKSSITMDTLYAEGQRRYVESLSSYARQFMTRIKKPDLDYIKGISPAIAIHQKVRTGSARSTVGTMTELFDYLRLLYARVGKTFSPISGREVTQQTVTDIINEYLNFPKETRILITSLLSKPEGDSWAKIFERSIQRGYTRIWHKGETIKLEDALEDGTSFDSKQPIYLVLDRVVADPANDDNTVRVSDSIESALATGIGRMQFILESGEVLNYNTRLEMDGIIFIEPTPAMFNYNNSLGACPACEGYGMAIGIDPDKVVPNKQKSLYDSAIAPWVGEKGSPFFLSLLKNAEKAGIRLHTPYKDLTSDEINQIWQGTKLFKGIKDFFREIEAASYKIQNRVLLSRYRGRTTCPVCNGKRLRPESLYVKVNGRDLGEVADMNIEQLTQFFQDLKLTEREEQIAGRILLEINTRLNILYTLGLGYLSLQRLSSTLSGGETQRIHLTRLLGSNLTGSLYLLDEPSVGLHPRDTGAMVEALKHLRDLGNTVIVVEHEEEIIKKADYLVDMGPAAGTYGGEVVFQGNFDEIATSKVKNSLTLDYLTRRKKIEVPAARRKTRHFIYMEGANMHNLRNVDVKIPLRSLVCVSGVSGSGKSTLIKSVLYPALNNAIESKSKTISTNNLALLSGDIQHLTQIELIDQQPIGKSSRSNPVTYVKAYDYIRELFTTLPLSKLRGLKPKHFSFNVEGGRCETCKGEGVTVIDMQFLADVTLVCEECKGQRFKPEILEITYKGKSIFDVLEMDIHSAIHFFNDSPEIIQRLSPLDEIGLGYVRLGQASSTLSGGEAQRVKLASFLIKEKSNGHIFFIFDEPTTGLHFEDVRKLLLAMDKLIDKGHSVLIIEHNIEVLKCADYLIDIGPGGGIHGGKILYQGVPEGIKKISESYTATYLPF